MTKYLFNIIETVQASFPEAKLLNQDETGNDYKEIMLHNSKYGIQIHSQKECLLSKFEDGLYSYENGTATSIARMFVKAVTEEQNITETPTEVVEKSKPTPKASKKVSTKKTTKTTQPKKKATDKAENNKEVETTTEAISETAVDWTFCQRDKEGLVTSIDSFLIELKAELGKAMWIKSEKRTRRFFRFQGIKNNKFGNFMKYRGSVWYMIGMVGSEASNEFLAAQTGNQVQTPTDKENVQENTPEAKEVKGFVVGNSYNIQYPGDSELFTPCTITKITAKRITFTVRNEDPKTVKLNVSEDGTQWFLPEGKFSLAPYCDSKKLIK